MEHIAHIEGLQGIILHKLTSSHLSKMVSLSREWVKPSLDRVRQMLSQFTKEFSHELGEETGVDPTARSKFGWNRNALTPPSGHGWAYIRGAVGYRWAWAHIMREEGWPSNPRNPPKVIKLLRNLIFTNCRSGSHFLKQKYNEYRDLCVKHNLLHLRPIQSRPGFQEAKWSHRLYKLGDYLFKERLQIELKREKLVKLFRTALPQKGYQYYINNFAKATRPDLMIQRLSVLTHYLQKT